MKYTYKWLKLISMVRNSVYGSNVLLSTLKHDLTDHDKFMVLLQTLSFIICSERVLFTHITNVLFLLFVFMFMLCLKTFLSNTVLHRNIISPCWRVTMYGAPVDLSFKNISSLTGNTLRHILLYVGSWGLQEVIYNK